MQFIVQGPIKSKARARTFYDPKLGRHRSVTPEGTVIYENWVRFCYTRAKENDDSVKPFMNDEPLHMSIHAYFTLPKSFSKAKRELAEEGRLFPTKKPDVDNIAKIICDALNGIAYGDDKQIVELIVKKRYTKHENAEPFAVIAIKELENFETN